MVDVTSYLETIHLPLLVVGKDGDVRFANASAQDLFSVSLKAMKRIGLFEFVKPSLAVKSLIEKVAKTGIGVSAGDVNFITPSMKEIVADISVGKNWQSEEYVVVFWPRNHAAEAMERKSANEKDKSFGQIGRALAHEVKNPLAGIRGAAQLLMLDAASSQKPLAKLIIEETDRVHRLIDRVESLGAEEEIPLKAMNVHSVIDRVIQLAQNGFASDLNISREFDVSLPPVLGEADRLTQVFLNLAKNASEAAREKGSSGRISFVTRYRHGYKIINSKNKTLSLPIEISVIDNGYGINEELRSLVFDPFVTTKSEGSGLGLALVRKMVAAMGGDIELDCQPGKTIFKVRLMVAQEAFGEEL
jgi:two-component system, NtrC family, nitrogen regulation sensor histidine kinase GlnL